jgi:hypothetical protein
MPLFMVFHALKTINKACCNCIKLMFMLIFNMKLIGHVEVSRIGDKVVLM